MERTNFRPMFICHRSATETIFEDNPIGDGKVDHKKMMATSGRFTNDGFDEGSLKMTMPGTDLLSNYHSETPLPSGIIPFLNAEHGLPMENSGDKIVRCSCKEMEWDHGVIE